MAGKKICVALLGGGQGLAVLTHVAQAREHGIARESVGAVISANGALEQAHGDLFLTAEAELLRGDIPVLGVRIGEECLGPLTKLSKKPKESNNRSRS